MSPRQPRAAAGGETAHQGRPLPRPGAAPAPETLAGPARPQSSAAPILRCGCIFKVNKGPQRSTRLCSTDFEVHKSAQTSVVVFSRPMNVHKGPQSSAPPIVTSSNVRKPLWLYFQSPQRSTKVCGTAFEAQRSTNRCGYILKVHKTTQRSAAPILMSTKVHKHV